MNKIYIFILFVILANAANVPKFNSYLDKIKKELDKEKDPVKKEEMQEKYDIEKDNCERVDNIINNLVENVFPDANARVLVLDKNWNYPTDYEDCLNDIIAIWNKYCGGFTGYVETQKQILKNVCTMHDGEEDGIFETLKELCSDY